MSQANSSNSNSSSISSSLNQLKLNNLPQLKLSHTAKTTILSNQIIQFIVDEIKKIPHFETMNNDLHLFLFICNCIENLQRSDLNPKLIKKDIFLEIVKQLFPTLSTDNLMFLDNFVDFICSNGLVNRVSYFSYVYNALKKNLPGN